MVAVVSAKSLWPDTVPETPLEYKNDDVRLSGVSATLSVGHL